MTINSTGAFTFGEPVAAGLAAQARAKSVLLRLGDKAEGVRFTFSPQSVERALAFESFDIESGVLDERPDEALDKKARFVAELWESLSFLPEVDSQSALLNAAIDYEIAGFQANSMCISNAIANSEALDPITKLVTEFLRRRFRSSLLLATDMARDPRTGWPESTASEYLLCAALIAQAVRKAIRGLMRGETGWRLAASGDLLNAEKIAAGYGLADAGALSRSFRSLLPIIERRSTWKAFAPLLAKQPRWRRYLTLLARGSAGRVKLSDTSIVELWPSQLEAIRSNVLDTDNNLLIRMPTSSGKTRIGEMAIVRELLRDDSAKCVYIAPFRALVSEVSASLSSVLGDLGYKVSALIETSSDASAYEEDILEKTSVFVTTPERLDLVVRARPDLSNAIKLVIIDEGHVLAEPERGLRFELFITRILRHFKGARLLFLSAVISEQTLTDVAEWLGAGDRILSSDWRPTRQKVAMLRWDGSKGFLRYAKDETDDIIDQFVPRIIQTLEYFEVSAKTGRKLARQYPDKSKKAEIAASLAFTLAELGPVMIFASQRNYVEAIARALVKRIAIETEGGRSIPAYFTQAAVSRSSYLARDTYPEAADWLSKGIAVHHRTLPESLKAAIEEDFRARKFQVIVATSTLAQGVNFPVRSVIFHTTTRHDEDLDKRVNLEARDYWNIAGRAGRAGEETESLVVHVCYNAVDEANYERYLAKRHAVEPLKSALLRALEQLIDDRVTDRRLGLTLDSQILAILAEEVSFGTSIAQVCRETIEFSLARIQAARQGRSIDELVSEFEKSASAVVEGIDDSELLKVFAATGLSSSSCKALLLFIDDTAELCERVAIEGESGDCRLLLRALLAVAIPETEPEEEFSGDSFELLEQWLNGVPVTDLTGIAATASMELGKLARYVEDAFSSKLSWASNALLILLCHRFGLSRSQVSRGAQYLSTTVRLGVPNPVACWAISSGVPLRSVAACIASTYLDAQNQVDVEAFTAWYQSLEADDFLRCGLPTEFLDDIAQRKTAAGANKLARSVATIEECLPLRTEVARYADREVPLRVGTELRVSRDLEDPIDRNAVLLWSGRTAIAKLPREVGQLIAPEIDIGSEFVAAVIESGRYALSVDLQLSPQMRLGVI